MTITTIAFAQVLLTLQPTTEAPLRFGFPLPATALARGLRVRDAPSARLAWRPLQQRADPQTGRLWVELCVTGGRPGQSLRIVAGGAAAVDPQGVPAAAGGTPGATTGAATGAAVARRELTVDTGEDRRTECIRWRWHTGLVDEVRRIHFTARQQYPADAAAGAAAGAADEQSGGARRPVQPGDAAPAAPADPADPAAPAAPAEPAERPVALPQGEEFAAGESLTLGYDPARFSAAGIRPSDWRRAGVLPPGGKLGRPYRRRLLAVVQRLVEGEGLRDRGDYRRSRDVMTNLEFDTALAFARLGLAEGRAELLQRAWRSATHSVDHDLDPRSGLLFCHGADHRSGAPDPGHTWLAGVLLVGCVAADQHLIDAAGRIARGLCRRPARGEGRQDRVRDIGWPLLEMEAWLRFADDREVTAGAAELVRRLVDKWDADNALFRFGEGERRRGLYDAPAWVTAGSLLPGLRAYLARTGDSGVRQLIAQTERRLASLLCDGKPGIPVRYLCVGGAVIRATRTERTPSGFMLLEGLALRDLRRGLGRGQVGAALLDVPALEDPDLPTSFTIAARCWWVYR